MKLTSSHFIGIGIALAIGVLDIVFLSQKNAFYFILGIAFAVGFAPFLFSILTESSIEKEKEEKFLEFTRDLVESVKTGTPISRAIINVRNKDYGFLTPHVMKLANQVSLGIPVKSALSVFAKDIENKVISRSVTLISEAEEAGGEIFSILEAVAKSISQTEDIKKQQKAAIYNLILQGYIIFVVFIIIVLITQFKIVPLLTELGSVQKGISLIGLPSIEGGISSPSEFVIPMLVLMLTQSFFTGLVIGKISEGKLKAGIKHSFILILLAFLVETGALAIFG